MPARPSITCHDTVAHQRQEMAAEHETVKTAKNGSDERLET